MRFRTLAMLFMFLAGSAVPLAAKDPSKAPEPKPKDDKEEVVTFTTEDLERRYGNNPKRKPKSKSVVGPQANRSKGKPTGEHPASDLSPKEEDYPDVQSWLAARQEAMRQKVAQRAEAKRAEQAAQAEMAALPKGKHPANEAAPPDADPDPLQWLQQRQDAEREKAAQRAQAQQRVKAAQDKVAGLEKRLASLRNPFLGRVQPPDEEKEAWKGTNQVGRIRITEENLVAARGELTQARTALNELR